MFYSGLPLAEEQRYTGQQFLPAVANLRAKYSAQRFSLQDAIAKITQDQYLRGQDIYQIEKDRDMQERLARASGGGGGFGGYGNPTTGGGGNEAKPPDPLAYAAREKDLMLGRGDIRPGAREQVRDNLVNQYGLSYKEADQIMWKLFPNGWEGDRMYKEPQQPDPGYGTQDPRDRNKYRSFSTKPGDRYGRGGMYTAR